MIRVKLYKYIFSILLIIYCCAGCISIPQEAPELSAELGNQISSIENSHITLLHKYFNDKREKIDDFILNDWAPLLSQNFFSNSQIKSAWISIVSDSNNVDRQNFIVKVTQTLQKKINEKRIELISPLEDFERALEQEIRRSYAQAYAMNNSITSFLVSASDLAENRDRYMNMVGVTDEKVSKIINETDIIISDFLSKSKNIEEEAEAENEYKKKLELLIKKL